MAALGFRPLQQVHGYFVRIGEIITYFLIVPTHCLPSETSTCRHLIHLASYHSTFPQLSMKRTGATLDTTPSEDAEDSKGKVGGSKDGGDKQSKNSKAPKIVQATNIKREDPKKKSKSGKAQDDVGGPEVSLQISKTAPKKMKNKLNFRNLTNREKDDEEELKPNVPPAKNKPRAVVNLDSMKEELKQLLDPPVSLMDRALCSARLDYSFFDTSCEQLAQNLLGKVLVRHLENGTVLKGRIVETEGYLGAIDKASHSYQNKVTQRNIPMYMPPGTIYVYMTYGMYHCFNISSQEPGSFVRINAMEPLVGTDYMELLRNMEPEENGKYKKIARDARHIDPYQLCNSPTKVCSALDIDCDRFNSKTISTCDDLWLEAVSKSSTTVVAARESTTLSFKESKVFRFYVLGSPSITQQDSEGEERDGCAVLIRAVEPLEGIEHMAAQRSKKGKKASEAGKTFKAHELCNGPSKLCMAYQLEKCHSKYSMCTWRGLWLENHSLEEEIEIVKSTRIGIDSCGSEWANKPLRYYVYGNKCVSKRDRKAEELMKLK